MCIVFPMHFNFDSFKEVAAQNCFSCGVSFDGSVKVWGRTAGKLRNFDWACECNWDATFQTEVLWKFQIFETRQKTNSMRYRKEAECFPKFGSQILILFFFFQSSFEKSWKYNFVLLWCVSTRTYAVDTPL